MQRHISAELYDNDLLHYVQLYLYDSKFAIQQRIIRNSQLNLDLLCQLTKVIYNCNSFINIYKTATEWI